MDGLGIFPTCCATLGSMQIGLWTHSQKHGQKRSNRVKAAGQGRIGQPPLTFDPVRTTLLYTGLLTSYTFVDNSTWGEADASHGITRTLR
jgi:hypothetical protein